MSRRVGSRLRRWMARKESKKLCLVLLAAAVITGFILHGYGNLSAWNSLNGGYWSQQLLSSPTTRGVAKDRISWKLRGNATANDLRCYRHASGCFNNSGVPCEYDESVGLRVISMAFNRHLSLAKSLGSLHELRMDGDRVAVDVWLDGARHLARIDERTFKAGLAFADNFTLGSVCVHNQSKHVYIAGQWIDSWRPKERIKKMRPAVVPWGTPEEEKQKGEFWSEADSRREELGLILEDDIDVSPMAYRWLRAVHQKFGGWSNISGYTLQMENINFFAPGLRPMKGPVNDTVFLYPVLGTWGFAPHPASWRRFQEWYHRVKDDKSFKPYVPGIVPTGWYKMFESFGRQESMWEMYHIYFTYISRQWCVYSNLVEYSGGAKDVYLSRNRKEAGLHYTGKEKLDNTTSLMTEWNPEYVIFPEALSIFSYTGVNINHDRVPL